MSVTLQGGDVAGVKLEGEADVLVFLRVSDFGKDISIAAPLVGP